MIPDVVRSDRGPEMTSAVAAGFPALLSVRHAQGAAFMPRHQGPGERAHQTIMNNHPLLMSEVFRAFPQVWAALVPALEYLRETAPREPSGLSAFDLSQGYGLLVDADRRLAPFNLLGPPRDGGSPPVVRAIQGAVRRSRVLHGQ